MPSALRKNPHLTLDSDYLWSCADRLGLQGELPTCFRPLFPVRLLFREQGLLEGEKFQTCDFL